MKQYTIIGGVSGVGKSSLSGILRQLLPDMGILIDPNRIAAQEHCDRLTAEKLAISKAKDCLKKGINFSQETTLSGRQTLQTVQQARNENYHIRLYDVGIRSAEESLLRIQNRVRKGGHDTPVQDVYKQYENRFADLVAVLPYCDNVHFYDNENGFQKIACYQNGIIFPLTDRLPQWMQDFMNVQKTDCS